MSKFKLNPLFYEDVTDKEKKALLFILMCIQEDVALTGMLEAYKMVNGQQAFLGWQETYINVTNPLVKKLESKGYIKYDLSKPNVRYSLTIPLFTNYKPFEKKEYQDLRNLFGTGNLGAGINRVCTLKELKVSLSNFFENTGHDRELLYTVVKDYVNSKLETENEKFIPKLNRFIEGLSHDKLEDYYEAYLFKQRVLEEKESANGNTY